MSAPRRALVLLQLGCLASLGGEASARTRTVVGGTASTSYVYTGAEQSIFFEGVSHDARFEAGGLVGLQHLRPGEELALALFGGAVAAARSTSFRNALVRGDLAFQRNLTRRAALEAGLYLDLRPVSTGLLESSAASADLRGSLALMSRPAVRAAFELGPRDELRVGAPGRLYALLREKDELKADQVGLAFGVDPEAIWRHRFAPSHSLLVDGFARVHQNRPGAGPLTNLAGGLLVGYGLRWRDQLWLDALAGGQAVSSNLRLEYLPAFLPAVKLRGELRGRLDLLRLDAAFTVEQNHYAGGLPQRSVIVSLAHLRIPTWRPLRWSVGLDYKFSTYSMLASQPQKPLEQCPECIGAPVNLHAGRVAGRLYLSLGRWWRAVGEVAASLGLADVPGTEAGVHLSALLGVACLYDEREEDEVLLRDLW